MVLSLFPRYVVGALDTPARLLLPPPRTPRYLGDLFLLLFGDLPFTGCFVATGLLVPAVGRRRSQRVYFLPG